MDEVPDEAASFEQLAAVVEGRANRLLRHSGLARQEAEDAGAANNAARELHLREARMHERSAELLKQTADLYRTRALEIKAMALDHSPEPPEDWQPQRALSGVSESTGARIARLPEGAPTVSRSFAAERKKLAAERERIAAEREQLVLERERIVAMSALTLGERLRLATQRPPGRATADQPPRTGAD